MRKTISLNIVNIHWTACLRHIKHTPTKPKIFYFLTINSENMLSINGMRYDRRFRSLWVAFAWLFAHMCRRCVSLCGTMLYSQPNGSRHHRRRQRQRRWQRKRRLTTKERGLTTTTTKKRIIWINHITHTFCASAAKRTNEMNGMKMECIRVGTRRHYLQLATAKLASCKSNARLLHDILVVVKDMYF